MSDKKMTDRDSETPEWIIHQLEDPANSHNPLLPALKYLLEQDKEHRARLDRMLRISDGYGNLVHNQTLSLSQRYDKQLRRLEKITRISDRYQQEMLELNLTLRQAALHDPLTGLPNRRMILDRMKSELARQERGSARFSLIMPPMAMKPATPFCRCWLMSCNIPSANMTCVPDGGARSF